MGIKHIVVGGALSLSALAAVGCEEVAVDPWKTGLPPGICEEVFWCLCREPLRAGDSPLCYDRVCNVCYEETGVTIADWWDAQYSDEPMACEAEMDWLRFEQCRSPSFRADQTDRADQAD